MANSKQNWQKWAVPLLMGLNVLFLVFMLWQQFSPSSQNERDPNRGKDIKAFLRRELELNDTQWQEYQALIEEHQRQNRANHERLRQLMDQQLDMISRGLSEDEVDLIAQEVGVQHADLIRNNAAHFAALREILSPEQNTKLAGLLKEVMGRMGRPMAPGGRRPPPPKRK